MWERKMAVAGIHFGNTNCSVAVCKDGKTAVVSNETGERFLPTCVGYTGAEKIVGFPAKQLAARCPQSVINNVKKLIGTSHLEESVLKSLQENCWCQVIIEKDCPQFEVKFDESTVTVNPADAAKFVLTKLLENAETVGGADLEDTVLAVPTWFTEKQRIELSEACEDTGFNVLRIISEPAAALLSYGIGQDDPNERSIVVVCRIGGSTSDATLIEINSGMYRVIASKIDHALGGDVFDDTLVKVFKQEFKRKFKLDLSESKRSLRKLKVAAEQCKCTLSSNNNATCSVDSLHEGIDFSYQVTRAKFESHCSEAFGKCCDIVLNLLKENNFETNDIDKVLLVGGSTRIPKIRQMFTEKFAKSEVLSGGKPEEIIATGAANQAAIIQGKEEIDFADLTCPLECTSRNISIEVIKDGSPCLETVIRKYTPVPLRRDRSFEASNDHKNLCFKIYETIAENDISDSDKHLAAKIILNDVKKGSLIKSKFEMTRDCSLHVTITDEEQNRTESVDIELNSS